ncbi:hypothetical protein ANCDUO_18713 [Ancylostoma duodenale]|uniref:Uncharacterized protein n=1 Tax=Ancylostoma duodenale TaxID=51022 RepID=A0A0C2CN84_9BILA|nr:hypothetical protein ANCDUO_18713 [Ancylostoma duodenale]
MSISGITPEDAQVDFSPLGNVTLTSSELFFHLDILSLTITLIDNNTT